MVPATAAAVWTKLEQSSNYENSPHFGGYFLCPPEGFRERRKGSLVKGSWHAEGVTEGLLRRNYVRHPQSPRHVVARPPFTRGGFRYSQTSREYKSSPHPKTLDAGCLFLFGQNRLRDYACGGLVGASAN